MKFGKPAPCHLLCQCIMLETQREQECLGAHLPSRKWLDGFGMAETCELSSNSIQCDMARAAVRVCVKNSATFTSVRCDHCARALEGRLPPSRTSFSERAGICGKIQGFCPAGAPQEICKIPSQSNDNVRNEVNEFFTFSSQKHNFIQTSVQHVLSHVMVDDHGEVNARTKFRFVANESGKYKASIQQLIQYARGVFLNQGLVSKIMYESVTGDGYLIAGFVFYPIATIKGLEDLQHVLMTTEFGMRAAVLVVVKTERKSARNRAALHE